MSRCKSICILKKQLYYYSLTKYSLLVTFVVRYFRSCQKGYILFLMLPWQFVLLRLPIQMYVHLKKSTVSKLPYQYFQNLIKAIWLNITFFFQYFVSQSRDLSKTYLRLFSPNVLSQNVKGVLNKLLHRKHSG